MEILCIKFEKRKTKKYCYLGVWMKPISRLKESGVIYIVPLTKKGKRLMFSFVRNEITAASIGDHGGSPVYTHADHWSQSYSHGNTDIKVKYFREKTLL